MAQLKDTIVSGNLRVTDTTLTDTLQVTTIKAPTSSGGSTYGPGTSGQVLKSNGTSVYWTSDSNTDEKVKATKLAQSTAEAAYYPTLVSGAGTAGVSIFDSAKINHTPGTTSVVGNTRLILGNATASGTANNEEGLLKLYSPGTSYHTLKGASTSSIVEHTLPTTGGTVLNTGTTSVTAVYGSTGTHIATVKVNGSDTKIYAPTNTDEKVKVDLFTSTTATDYMIAGATAAMATTAGHLVIDTADGVAGARIRLQKGTTADVGQAMLMLGNNIASGTAKNMQGSILMYTSTANYGKITPAALTDTRTWTMPNKTGTVALTSDIPLNYVPFTKITTAADADTYAANTGWYDWNTTSGTNMPTENWGILLSKGYPSVQMFLPDTGTAIYLRKKTNASTAGTSWMGITGTAGNTYNLNNFLPLSGGTMTGTIQGTYTNTHIALAGGGIGDYATLDHKNNINISSWNGVSISNGCSSVGTIDQVTFSVNARTGTTQQRGNAILYSESGNSPALIFQRGTFLDNVYDWRIYVNGGNLYFEHSITSSSSTQSWVQDMMFLANDKRLKVTSATENTTPCFFVERSDTSASVWFGIGSGGVNHGIFSGSINSWVFVANATEAQTYNIAKNPSTATTYAISFGGETFTTGLKSHYVNDGLRYRTREGVANTEGLSILVLGNGLASSVAKNKTGYVRQYSTNEYYTDLKPNTLTASRTILLPDAAGTIAVFPAARTSGQVVVTDGTAGAVKSSGYTIATSVPSGAKFTDENVKQSETTTNQYRPIVLGATYSTDPSTLAATITAQTYVSKLLYAQPEGGILYANRMYLKAPGSKGQLNLLTSKYNVMLRNDDSNTYFLVTAQNDPSGTWTSARPLTINNSTGVCNINGTSSSWATARTLTLGGQLTGSVSVKGDANMTLNGYLDRAFIYDDNAVPANHTWAEYAWHKFAEVTITDEFEDRVITFLVSRTHGSSAENTGILSAKLRTKENKVYDSAQLKWLVRNSGLNKDDFVMVYTSTSGTSTKAELWCRIPGQYHGLVFTVLKEHQRYVSASSDWTLVKTPKGSSTHGSSSYPTTGITDKIISSDGIITNSTTGTATSANALNLTHSNELNFSKLSSTGHVWFGYRWNTQGTETSGGTTITTYKFGNANGAQGLAGIEADSLTVHGNSGAVKLQAAEQATGGTYLLPARGNLKYTLSCGHEDLSAPTGSLSAANVLVPSYTKFIKIVFKSDSSSTLYSMVEIPYFGNGDYGALVQVGTFGDSQGAFRIIMKAVIILITDGTQTGTKNFTITASPTTKINGSNVSDITRNITIHKIYAVD